MTTAHLLSDDGDFRKVLGQRGADALLSQSVCQSLKVIDSSLSFITRRTSWCSTVTFVSFSFYSSGVYGHQINSSMCALARRHLISLLYRPSH